MFKLNYFNNLKSKPTHDADFIMLLLFHHHRQQQQQQQQNDQLNIFKPEPEYDNDGAS